MRYTVYLGYPKPIKVTARDAESAIEKAIAKAHKQFPIPPCPIEKLREVTAPALAKLRGGASQ